VTSPDGSLRIRPAGRARSVAGRRLPLRAADLDEILPHRGQFRLVDRVDELDPGARATGTLLTSRAAAYFDGHFPDRPVLAGVLLIEALAQLSGIVLWSAVMEGLIPDWAPGGLHVLAGVNRMRFRRVVLPGDVVRLETALTARTGRVAEFQVKALVERETAADGAVQIGVKET